MEEKHYPLPPFTEETAKQKIQLAEDAWNTREPERIAKAYTPNSEWRNRNEFMIGREEIIAFLTRKWQKELNYKLRKEYWAHTGNRIAVRTLLENGFVLMVMKTGNLMSMDIWRSVTPA